MVLLGSGEGFDEVAAELGCELDPGLDVNLVQMPLAGSLLDTAMKAETDVSVLVNSDIMFTDSVVQAIDKARMQFEDWFLMGARYDLQELPSLYEPSHGDFSNTAFTNYARTKGVLHTAGGVDYFIWNNRPHKRLLHDFMPPFIRGKSKCKLESEFVRNCCAENPRH